MHCRRTVKIAATCVFVGPPPGPSVHQNNRRSVDIHLFGIKSILPVKRWIAVREYVRRPRRVIPGRVRDAGSPRDARRAPRPAPYCGGIFSSLAAELLSPLKIRSATLPGKRSGNSAATRAITWGVSSISRWISGSACVPYEHFTAIVLKWRRWTSRNASCLLRDQIAHRESGLEPRPL